MFFATRWGVACARPANPRCGANTAYFPGAYGLLSAFVASFALEDGRE